MFVLFGMRRPVRTETQRAAEEVEQRRKGFYKKISDVAIMQIKTSTYTGVDVGGSLEGRVDAQENGSSVLRQSPLMVVPTSTTQTQRIMTPVGLRLSE
jgi:hypothetical protein